MWNKRARKFVVKVRTPRQNNVGKHGEPTSKLGVLERVIGACASRASPIRRGRNQRHRAARNRWGRAHKM